LRLGEVRQVREVREVRGISHEYDCVLRIGLLPAALVIEVSIGADGTDDVEIRGFGLVGALEDSLECGSDGEATAGGEAGGVDVAVNGGVVGDAIVAGELFRAPPAEEVLLDIVAFGVAAYPALKLVVSQIGRLVWGAGDLRLFFVSHGRR
jgi:hypothetical protein